MKRAVPPELEAEPPGAAGGAQARVGAVGARGKEVRAEILVERGDDVADLQVARLLHRVREVAPERAHHRPPVRAPAGDVVELLFERGGEAGVDVMLEEADQERGDQPAAILRDEPPVLQPHIVAVLQHGEDGGVGGGPADAQLLHLLHQARLGIARRRLGEVLRGVDLAAAQCVLLGHRRQHAILVILRRVVLVFAIELQEPVEDQRGAGGAQPRAVRARGVGDLHRHLIELRRLHLARDRALPDEFVEPALLGRQVARHAFGRARNLGRPDRLVRLLRVLRPAGVFARGTRQIVGAIALAHMVANGADRLARHLHAVGAHVGDEPDRLAADVDAFIELLREPHRRLRAEAELAARLLLQG